MASVTAFCPGRKRWGQRLPLARSMPSSAQGALPSRRDYGNEKPNQSLTSWRISWIAKKSNDAS